MKEAEIKKVVREGYGKIAQKDLSGCGPVSSCCGSQDMVQDISKRIGYSDEEIKVVPEGANLGLGCGNPVALASLKKGEVVLDLGSGAGFDCFLAANQVGKEGKSHRSGHDGGKCLTGQEKTPGRETMKMWNSGWAKLKIYRWPITLWISSFPTA